MSEREKIANCLIFANYFIKLLDHGVNFPIKRKKTKKVPFSKRIICKAENKKNFTKTPPKKANLSNPPQYITLELIFWLVLKWEVLFWLLMLKLEALLLLLLDHWKRMHTFRLDVFIRAQTRSTLNLFTHKLL